MNKTYPLKKLIFALFLINSLCLFTQTNSFVKEYTYKAGEADSKLSSKTLALKEVKTALLEEIGVYLSCEFENEIEQKQVNGKTEFNQLTKSNIITLSAAITKTTILDEKWNGETYYLKAEIIVDIDDAKKKLKELVNDKAKIKELEDIQAKNKEANDVIDKLKKELETAKAKNIKLSEKDKTRIQENYNEEINILDANDWYQKGYYASEAKKDGKLLDMSQKTAQESENNLEKFLSDYSKKGCSKLINSFYRASELYEKGAGSILDKDNIQIYGKQIKVCKATYYDNWWRIDGNMLNKKLDALSGYQKDNRFRVSSQDSPYNIRNIDLSEKSKPIILKDDKAKTRELEELKYVNDKLKKDLERAFKDLDKANDVIKKLKKELETVTTNNLNTIKIGTQTWTTKNLDVTTYRNGEVIPQVQDANAWANLSTGAWCYYENNTANGSSYGKLYNWYAVNDPRGLAPKGYHIPTDAEWKILTDYLGGESVAGTKMKSTQGWDEYGNGTNSSGFNGLPGGDRYFYGNFVSIGYMGSWWSSSSSKNYTSAWERDMHKGHGYLNRSEFSKKNGYSVRCLRD